MNVFFGTINPLGHPFYPHPGELVIEREIGKHTVACWSDPWADHGPELMESYNPDAVVLWNPMWFTSKTFSKLEEWAHSRKIPLFGILGDWFSGLRSGNPHRTGTALVLPNLDGIVIDLAGASAMRYKNYPGKIAAFEELLTYGRLVTLGADEQAVLDVDLDRKRDIDVCFVGHRHENHVVQRSYFLDKVEELCKEKGWEFFECNTVLFSNLENVLLDSKVVFNYAVGSMPNCRIYEACAAGCGLVTDAQCIGIRPLWPMLTYTDWDTAEDALDKMVEDPILRKKYAQAGLHWVTRRSPMKTWSRIFDACEEMLA